MRVGRSAYLTARHSAPMLRIMVREILQRDSVRAHWDEARQSAFTVFARALAGATGNSSRSRACSAIARTFLDTVLFEALFGPAMDADALIASIVGTISLPGPGHASDEVGKEEGMDP